MQFLCLAIFPQAKHEEVRVLAGCVQESLEIVSELLHVFCYCLFSYSLRKGLVGVLEGGDKGLTKVTTGNP